MANWMMTGMTMEQVEKTRVFVTNEARIKLLPCERASMLWFRLLKAGPLEVTEKSIRRFRKYDVYSWVRLTYYSMRNRCAYWRTNDWDGYNAAFKQIPKSPCPDAKLITLYTKAMVIAAKRFFDAQASRRLLNAQEAV